MKALQGKTALVAGGTGGVGEGIVKSLLQGGMHVIVPTRSSEKGEQLRQYLGEDLAANLSLLIGDLSNEPAAMQLREEVYRTAKNLDLVVASLGGWWQGVPLTSVDFSTWQRIMTNNLTSHYLAVRAFVPLIRPQSGTYVHINGFGAEEPVPMAAPVAMAAAAQKQMALTLAEELRPAGIRVYELILGPMLTRQRLRHSLGRAGWYAPEEIGRYITELVSGLHPRANDLLHRLLQKPASDN